MITFGDGAAVATYLGDGTPTVGGSPRLGLVTFTTTGATFAPVLVLSPGSTAVVTWQDASGATLATGLAPAINFGSAGTRTVRLHCTSYAGIVSVNLGFDHAQDAGKEGPGAGYDKAPVALIGVSGINALTGLVQFLAANTTLTGPLDLTGMAALQFVECFGAKLTSITLTGCTSLIRLCLESNRIEQFDLNPVVTNLRDLRAAVQWDGPSVHALDFVPLTAPMAQLWHYCVRDQHVTRPLPHSLLPVVEQHWAWNTGLATADSPISTLLRDYQSQDNSYDQASINRILIALDTLIPTGTGILHLAGDGAAPSGAGITARGHLIGRGWDVTTN